MDRYRPRHRQYTVLLLLASIMLASGCSQFIDPNVPEPIRHRIEPQFQKDYLLYRPSQYDPKFKWPLVVVLPGSFPDSPNRRIRAWTMLAESHGFLVAAPKIESVRRHWPNQEERQRVRIRNDERHVLAVVRHVLAGQNVSEDRIFLHGYGQGAHVALSTGLGHSELFRAITISQPRFEEAYLEDATGVVDHDQPILVTFDLSDSISGNHATHCGKWLRARGANVTSDSHGRDLSTNAARSVRFLKDLLRRGDWFRIRAFSTHQTNPLEMQFKLRAVTPPSTLRWDFGDGTISTHPEPVHAYVQPGTYRVVLALNDHNGKQHRRAVTVKVPEATIGPASTGNGPEGHSSGADQN